VTLLDFGQPVGGIVQIAYVVDDIDRSAAEFTAQLGIGPWFVRGPFVPPSGRLRGRVYTDIRQASIGWGEDPVRRERLQ
jgi:hypothetical protein